MGQFQTQTFSLEKRTVMGTLSSSAHDSCFDFDSPALSASCKQEKSGYRPAASSASNVLLGNNNKHLTHLQGCGPGLSLGLPFSVWRSFQRAGKACLLYLLLGIPAWEQARTPQHCPGLAQSLGAGPLLGPLLLQWRAFSSPLHSPDASNQPFSVYKAARF